ncbi:MAG: hypothetical protein NXI22_11895 [bacterium]|nr:hypothetical protein [bacterium]
MTDRNTDVNGFAAIWRWISKHPVLAFFGTIIVGAIGSGFWEICIRPSGWWIFQGFMFVVTFGSDSIRDSAYASAALDQSAIPSMCVLLSLVSVLLGFYFAILRHEFRLWPKLIAKRIGEIVPERAGGDSDQVRLENLEAVFRIFADTRHCPLNTFHHHSDGCELNECEEGLDGFIIACGDTA